MSLYLDHFGLRESPYRITPHTEFFFDGANRGATLDALVYAIVHDEGIVKVTGEVGSGKTMLCRMLLERLPPTVETIYFSNPSLNREELLLALADELQLPTPPSAAHQLLRAIQQHLVDLHEAGKQVVVLIDEAHAMPEESLEEIRLLSNLETQRAKLLQIVLFGQPELNDILGTQHMRQLRERVTHNFFLDPLKQPDIATYLDFRLRAAGYRGPSVFSPDAIKRFAEVSHGLTRRLNILADKALLAAFAANTHLIDPPIARAAIADARFNDTGVTVPASGRRRRLAIGGGIAVLGTLLLLTGWLVGRRGEPAITTTPPAAQHAPLAPPLAAGGMVAPPPGGTSMAPLPPTIAPASPTTTGTVAPTVMTTSASPLPAAPAPTPAPTAQLPPVAPLVPAVPQEVRKSLLAGYRARFEDWIPSADGRQFSIQLLRVQAHHRSLAEEFLRHAETAADPARLYAYEASAGGQRWIGVVYGNFPSAVSAERDLAALPAAVRTHQPFVRPIRQLKP